MKVRECGCEDTTGLSYKGSCDKATAAVTVLKAVVVAMAVLAGWAMFASFACYHQSVIRAELAGEIRVVEEWCGITPRD